MVNLTYGKSMYGGWYAQSEYEPSITFHADTLKALKKKVADSDMVCNLKIRFDN